jgi:hypothetical protein
MSPEKIPSSEIELVQSLDALIKSGDFPLALKILKQVESTFSRYDLYMEKISQIKIG